MGTVNIGGAPAVKTFNQSMVSANSTIPTVTPVQPAIIPQSQNIATFGTQPVTLPQTAISQPTPQLNQAEQILKQTAVAETEAQKTNQNISKAMLAIIPQLQGQTQELATQQQVFGVQDLKQNLLNLNNQIIQKQAEIAKDDVTLANTLAQTEGGGILGSIVARQQLDTQRKAQLVRSLKMADIGILNAQALAAQGNIALAQDAAKQAVETKYAPYKELLETLKMQTEALQPILTADEKKQAREQDIRTNLALKEVDKAQKNEEMLNSMIINAASQNAPQTLLAKAKLEKDPAKAAMILGEYAGDYYKTQLLKAEINKTYKQIQALSQPISATGKIETLPKAQQERYYKLQGDFDKAAEKYKGAIDAAKNLNALSVNSTAQDQTAIIFSYMKTLDPSSTVREGEFALVGNTAGLGDRAINALAKLDSGKRLTEQQITDIVGAANKLANVSRKNLDATAQEYDRRATKFGLPTGLFYEPGGEVTADVKTYVDVIDRGLNGQTQSTPASYLDSLGIIKMGK